MRHNCRRGLYMATSYALLLEKQGFDDMMEFLDCEFQKLPDHRSGNALRYDLSERLVRYPQKRLRDVLT